MFGIKISEIDFVIEIKWYLTYLTHPKGPRGRGKKFAVARPIYVSNSHTKLGWISSNGLGGDSITDRRTEAITICPSLFKKNVGIINLANFASKQNVLRAAKALS